MTSLIKNKARAKCATSLNVLTCRLRRSFSFLDTIQCKFTLNNSSLFTKRLFCFVFFSSVAVSQSVSVGSCRGEIYVISVFFFCFCFLILENLHFLAMKKIVLYMRPLNPQFKPYNSILCLFFFDVFFF